MSMGTRAPISVPEQISPIEEAIMDEEDQDFLLVNADIDRKRKLSQDRIKTLYPVVDEKKTPLPRFWNNNDKYSYLIVSNQDLRVTYRGAGKNHKDAAAVRAIHPIPVTCGVYYFEVAIISKGRDGYMGIGLCEKEVNLNRLPGWESNSYGYHGDDGNIFSTSGNGSPYGPTFTTNDVVGCGYDLVRNAIFYTKNGQHLGVAFSDVSTSEELFPTVGLQTPGEIIDANFGQKPFAYDIEEDIKEAQLSVHSSIRAFQLPASKNDWMIKLVSSYLMHNGYCSTAESFNRATDQPNVEDLVSMTIRQHVRKLILNGHVAEAVEIVEQMYPGLLERNKVLVFVLKCRQFVELLATSSQEVDCYDDGNCARLLQKDARCSSSRRSSPACTPPYKPYSRHRSPIERDPLHSPRRSILSPCRHDDAVCSSSLMTVNNGSSFGMDDGPYRNGSTAENGASDVKNGSVNADQHMGGDNRWIMDAFSLICYKKPRDSQNGYLLDPKQRTPVADALNSAILESQGRPRQAPLEVLVRHAVRLREEFANSRIGAVAFADPELLIRDP